MPHVCLDSNLGSGAGLTGAPNGAYLCGACHMCAWIVNLGSGAGLTGLLMVHMYVVHATCVPG